MSAEPRRARFNRWWRSYAGSVAFLAVLVVGAVGFWQTEEARLESCRQRNELRAGLRAGEREEIARALATDPALFPDIPRERFMELLRESVEQAQFRIRERFYDVDCGSLFSH